MGSEGMTWQSTPSADEAARVAYWQLHMERSHELLRAMERHPVQECGEPLASIPDAARAAGVEMYFSDTPCGGVFPRIYMIRTSLLDPLLAAARDMLARGWVMKIEEGYRTKAMQTALGRSPAVFDLIVRTCARECGGRVPPVELVRRRAMCLVANYPLTGTHLFGAAVDISVIDRSTGREVSRGKPYLEMSEYTPMDSPFVTEAEHQNRLDITAIMERHGFVHYPGEFWHYNQGDALHQIITGAGRPGRYGPVHWDPRQNRITPFDANELREPLTPPEIQQTLIDEAMRRLGGGV
jgi:D-alanyl-D-alanine dipeptidase